MGYSRRLLFGFVALSVLVSVSVVRDAAADVFTSTSYEIDASVSGSFGGQTSSTNYKMVSSGGESVIGNGAGGSYKMGQGYVAQLEKSLQLNVLPEGVVGYFSFDENAGIRVYDSSQYTNDANATASPTWTTGKLGSALTFNGTTQYISLGNPSQYALTTGTVEAWVKSSVTTGQQAIVSKASNFKLLLDANRLAMYDYNTSTTCTEPTTGIADGQWHHVAMTFSSGVTNGSHLYKDGVHVQTCTMTTVANSNDLQIAQSSGGQFFNGTIDEVRLFNSVLTTDEVKAERDAQNAGIPTGLSLNVLTPGASQMAEYDAIVITDAPSYDLSILQDHDLQFGANTIPAVSGSIASPLTWNEGTTKGLGFTLYSTNATSIPGTWSSGSAYAAIPNTGTVFYTRSGYSGGAKDVLKMRLRADVATSQPSGFYTNMMTISGTMTP